MANTLVVVIDASQIDKEARSQQKVKVGVRASSGKIRSQVVAIKAEKLELKFAADAHGADVAIGPDDASDEDLFRLQTITQRVTAASWLKLTTLVLPPLVITPFYWAFWLRWCRNFVIHGRVLCPDGSPVPGAVVQAYDIDYLWWWSSRQAAGPAVVTDANGSFTIKFRWCCGWLPIWWWRLRHWALEPLLAGRILPVLRLDEKLPPIPKPDPVPDLRIFAGLMEPTVRPTAGAAAALVLPTPDRIDPASLGTLRKLLLPKLPIVPELQRLKLWPWVSWTPWTDCTPDIIFRVTQDCGQGEKVIVSETVFDVRWNIPTSLDVTLHANEDACCGVITDEPEGDCVVITKACQTLITDIEQNPLAPLVGLANPGAASSDSDRAFGGVVTLRGVTGVGAAIDYYEIEHSTTPAVPASWAPVSSLVAGGFTRSYLDISPGPTITPQNFPAAFSVIDGHLVVESLEHFEAGHVPPAGVLRVAVGGQDVLVNLLTADQFGDGVHFFRIKAYTLGAGNTLTNPRVLPLCNTATPAGIALRLDNRFVDGADPFVMPPPSPSQACGPGTVHTCTVEPDVRIINVQYDGSVLQPCDVIDTKPGGPLTIDFFAHDPDGMLSSYTLVANHGESLQTDLLALPGASLSTLSTAGFSAAQIGAIPQADAQGPTYLQALTAPQSALRPFWRGGLMRLVIPDVRSAFPDTCAYLLQIDAFKRTIADCGYWLPYRNRSHFSLTVIV